MVQFKQLSRALLLTLLSTQAGFAKDVEVVGSTQYRLKESNASARATSNDKTIQLLHVQLSEEAKERLTKRAADILTNKNQALLAKASTDNLPAKTQLGMNKVPVLDQGMHGTCVTFAVTAALDAVLNKGDYISQVCSLQLGSYLEKHGYSISGWDGSYARTVISQIEQYGIVNQDKQKKYGCGGLKQYPAYYMPNFNSFIEPETYQGMSEWVFGQTASWSNAYYSKDPERTLNEVKQALLAKDRLVFAVLLPRTDLGLAGAVGKHNTWFAKDSWVLTPEISQGVRNADSAHELVITGYDDNAEASDNHGNKHKGLLTLRNSWGDSVGDDGEFYMSYDYFKLLTYDVRRISPLAR
ncbi:Peptidase C1-like family protein [Legionella massiliensis]|uniref:Peptidase C1-like family protein n=1 Tax=Legionella massiliensis TaxID=1034943 RepID=A0A078L5E3_9GAMM|nr:C1 family peptidase [Legionella massiliensis]CDZ79309.1 Peptidase C1-like family protein [Legionella massiliensis]CEE15047.1 Peptidase C1-like family protein [Legionella massiliensis]